MKLSEVESKELLKPKFFVCGVNGVGKDTVIKAAQALHPEVRTMVASSALRNYLRTDYEGLRNCPHNLALAALGEIVRSFIKVTYRNDIFMFNAHVLNLVCGQRKEVVGDWLGMFDAMVLVTADPEVIFDRLFCGCRKRALFVFGQSIMERLTMFKDYARDYEVRFHELARQYDRPAFRLVNDGTPQEAGRALLEVHAHFSNGAR